MIGLDFGFTGNRYRQLDQGLYKLSINLLGSLCRLSTRRVEEMFPVNHVVARYCTESQEVRKERNRITVAVQSVAVTNLRVAVSVGRIGKFERYKYVMTGAEISRTFSEHLISKGRSD